MNDENLSDEKFRTGFDDRSRYRFEDYAPDAPQYPVNYQPNQMPRENFNANFERAKDEKQLDQLSLGFKIYAAINAAVACIPFIHLFIGIMIVSGGIGDGKDAPPAFFGWFFILVASLFIVVGWGISIANFCAGRYLKERRNYTFCFVMSCINCAFMPLGTLLGVFSIIVLVRDSVKDIFKTHPAEISSR